MSPYWCLIFSVIWRIMYGWNSIFPVFSYYKCTLWWKIDHFFSQRNLCWKMFHQKCFWYLYVLFIEVMKNLPYSLMLNLQKISHKNPEPNKWSFHGLFSSVNPPPMKIYGTQKNAYVCYEICVGWTDYYHRAYISLLFIIWTNSLI